MSRNNGQMIRFRKAPSEHGVVVLATRTQAGADLIGCSRMGSERFSSLSGASYDFGELMKLDEACVDHGQKGDRRGYGSAWRNGKTIGAHIAALIESSGEEPNGRYVLHSCDNARCINPRHLRWGTHAENMRDMAERGRAPGLANLCGRRADNRGENHGAAKLTEKMVVRIRKIYAAGGISQRKLAAQYGVSNATMSDVILRKKWKHI